MMLGERGNGAAGSRWRARSGALRVGMVLAFAWCEAAVPACNRGPRVKEVPAAEVGKAASFTSLGAGQPLFRVAGKAGSRVTLPIKGQDLFGLQPESVRVFRLDEQTGSWKMLPDSRINPATGNITAVLTAPGGGLFTVVGASQFEEVFDAQVRVCAQGTDIPGRPDAVPEKSAVSSCARPPSPHRAREERGAVAWLPLGENVCDQCRHGGQPGVRRFPRWLPRRSDPARPGAQAAPRSVAIRLLRRQQRLPARALCRWSGRLRLPGRAEPDLVPQRRRPRHRALSRDHQRDGKAARVRLVAVPSGCVSPRQPRRLCSGRLVQLRPHLRGLGPSSESPRLQLLARRAGQLGVHRGVDRRLRRDLRFRLRNDRLRSARSPRARASPALEGLDSAGGDPWGGNSGTTST